jgi:hypothetical protein
MRLFMRIWVRLWVRSLMMMLLMGVALGLATGCGSRPEGNAASSGKKKKQAAVAKPVKIDIPADRYGSVAEALQDVKNWDANNPKSGQELLKTEVWIVRQGESGVPTLTECIANESEDVRVRMTACRVLAKLGPVGRSAVMAATDSSVKPLRVKAVESLGRIKPADQASVDKLIKLIDDKDYDVRKAALLGLAFTGTAGKSAVPKLMKTLNNTNEDETVRSLAKDALKKVDPRKGLQGADKG